ELPEVRQAPRARRAGSRRVMRGLDFTGRRVMVTGAAGFIGMHTAAALLDAGADVLALDNFEPYYDVALKHARIATLASRARFAFKEHDLADAASTERLFHEERCELVVHLAAQAGVRHSLVDPQAYV